MKFEIENFIPDTGNYIIQPYREVTVTKEVPEEVKDDEGRIVIGEDGLPKTEIINKKVPSSLQIAKVISAPEDAKFPNGTVVVYRKAGSADFELAKKLLIIRDFDIKGKLMQD